MFDIFKKDIKVGDKVRLYLTTGKEPEGTVVEIGDNFVLLKNDDQTQSKIERREIPAKRQQIPIIVKHLETDKNTLLILWVAIKLFPLLAMKKTLPSMPSKSHKKNA